jgi:hypothetical protein
LAQPENTDVDSSPPNASARFAKDVQDAVKTEIDAVHAAEEEELKAKRNSLATMASHAKEGLE